MFPQHASERHCADGCFSRRVPGSLQRERANAFTLLELLIVIGIIAVLLVLIAPAFTNIKSGGDVTGAAYTIKGCSNRPHLREGKQHLHLGRLFCRVPLVSTVTGTRTRNPKLQKDGLTLEPA
jgi:prepilin-type N-terminal cleavage/methylation domain-containing protein